MPGEGALSSKKLPALVSQEGRTFLFCLLALYGESLLLDKVSLFKWLNEMSSVCLLLLLLSHFSRVRLCVTP